MNFDLMQSIIMGLQRICSLFSSSLKQQGILRHYSSTGGHHDVIIAGGGIMGCASAYFLAQRMSPTSICIVERDPTVRYLTCRLNSYISVIYSV